MSADHVPVIEQAPPPAPEEVMAEFRQNHPRVDTTGPAPAVPRPELESEPIRLETTPVPLAPLQAPPSAINSVINPIVPDAPTPPPSGTDR